MAHLPEYFVTASSNVEPEEDAKNAKSAHEDIRVELADDLDLTDLGLETRLIGSYGRNVSIKRVKDVDVFAMLEDADDSLESNEILNHIVGVLGENHDPADIRKQDHSVVVDLPEFDLSIDVVPARPYGDHWEIPDPDSEWLETNPLELGDLTTKLNNDFTLAGTGIYVPMVKLIRQVRRALRAERPSGLYFEILAYWAFERGEVSGNTRASCLASSLAGVQEVLEGVVADGELADPTLPDKGIATKATSSQLEAALAKVRSAKELAEGALEDEDPCESAKKWRKLLGTDSEGEWVFPIPEDCSDDAGLSSIYVPGEKRGPSGTDRFAMNPSIKRARTRWIEDLIKAGFEEVDSTERVISFSREFDVPISDGPGLEDSIEITIGPDFPYERPKVRTLFSATGNSWHRERDGSLCLWPHDNSVSDLPWKDAAVLIERIEEWLANSVEGWTEDLPILDLERYVGVSGEKFVFDAEDIEFRDKAFFNVSRSPSGGAFHYKMGPYVPRPPVGRDRKRKGHSATHGAAVDLGQLKSPFGTWEELTTLLPSGFADQVLNFVRMGQLDVLVLRYSREGHEAITVLKLGLKAKRPAIVGALTPVPGSRAVRMLRAGEESGLLSDHSVAVIGVGAVGSYVADFLVRRGVGRVLVMDFGDLRPGNAVRHLVADQSLELMPKVEAVRTRLHTYGFLEEDSVSVEQSGLHKVEAALTLLGEHDVLVDATASGESSALLSDLATRDTAAVVAVAIQRAGGVYRVDRYPGEKHYEALEGLTELTDGELLLEMGCADPVSPTTPDTVAEAAIWTVRVVIDLLLGTGRFGPTVLGVVEPQPDAPLDRVGIVVS